MKNKLVIYLLSLAMPLALFAKDGSTNPIFDKLDQDKDGFVSKEEAEANKKIASKFDELDADGDGQLSKAEFPVKTEKKEKEKKEKDKDSGDDE